MLQQGFSLIEVLIVITIIALIALAVLFTFGGQMEKGRDARRKSDLHAVKTAFEEYYSDYECYPPAEILDTCGGSELSPYLDEIPCDPKTLAKYYYAPEGSLCPSYYRVFSSLERETDEAISALGCNSETGCGASTYFPELGEEANNLNYGISQGVTFYQSSGRENQPPASGGDDGPPQQNLRYCCVQRVCNAYSHQDDNLCGGSLHETQAECIAACEE